MAELCPAPFRDLVVRVFQEPRVQGTLFDLPRRKWYVPANGAPDLSVLFHGTRAGNPLGPAAGPHTQMAQNLLLGYLAGARIFELKTVQDNDQLEIPRPCIDMTNVGYNVEWSQELDVRQSLHEYVAGSMLIHMFRHGCEQADHPFLETSGDVVFDISVGYDLAGIRGEKVSRFLDGMRDASRVVELLRDQIPTEFSGARNLDYPSELSHSITLSTFHGCPADEIEAIGEYLIGERGFDLIIKMNPPMLGQQRLEHLLYDVLGYHEVRVNPTAYSSGLQFEEAIKMHRRLAALARRLGRGLGYKFSNTLEVLNHRDFFTPDNKVMYLSGQPLHVITLALTETFRREVGADVPISFSAGIDKQNFPSAVACGFVPITVCTDLLKPGGYGRLPGYLDRLSQEMQRLGASNIDQYIRHWHTLECPESRDQGEGCSVRKIGLVNTALALHKACEDPRYHADQNKKIPKRMDSYLTVFDCITCDKCIPACPNDANFVYPTPVLEFEYQDTLITSDDEVLLDSVQRTFQITKPLQIACYADFCNECGNCDTFCPEYGGPYIEKPSFFGTYTSWQNAAPRDGFYVKNQQDQKFIVGRVKGIEYKLEYSLQEGVWYYRDEMVRACISPDDFSIQSVDRIESPRGDHRVELNIFHTLRLLLEGVLSTERVNQINAHVLLSEVAD